jgi:hypothetical protein
MCATYPSSSHLNILPVLLLQTFADAVPAGSVDCCEGILSQVGGHAHKEALSPLDSALSSKLLSGVGEPLALRQQALQLQA